MPPLPARPGRDRAVRPRADRSVRCERSTRPPRNGLRMKVGRPCREYGASVRSADALAGEVQRHDAVTIATAAVGRDDRTASNSQRRRSPTCAVFVHPRPSFSRADHLAAAFVRYRSRLAAARASMSWLVWSPSSSTVGDLPATRDQDRARRRLLLTRVEPEAGGRVQRPVRSCCGSSFSQL